MANTTAPKFNEVFKNSPFFYTDKEQTIGDQIKLTNKTPIVDVYAKLPWRSQTGPDPAELEIPYLTLTEFEIKLSGMLANINTIAQQFGSGILSGLQDVYKKLYVADPTKFVYKLPWLINQATTLMGAKNNWAENSANPISMEFGGDKTKTNKAWNYAQQAFKSAADLAKGSVAGINGLDTVQYFDGADKKSIEVSFPLYNTLDHKSAFDNYNFVLLLTFQNTMTRTSLFTHIPPKIYEVRSSVGGIYMAAAYLSNLVVTNIGTTRLLPASEFGHISEPILIPEAYRVSFTINDLLPPSTQLLAASHGDNLVSVISPTSEANFQPFGSLINNILTPSP